MKTTVAFHNCILLVNLSRHLEPEELGFDGFGGGAKGNNLGLLSLMKSLSNCSPNALDSVEGISGEVVDHLCLLSSFPLPFPSPLPRFLISVSTLSLR